MGLPYPPGSSLAWLIYPVTPEQYFERYWEQELLVVQRGQSDYFSRLLSIADVDRVITTLDRRYPDIVLKNAAASISSSDYTMPGGAIDVARLYQLFEKGSTITLAYLDTLLPALTLFCRGLENEFSFPFQTNVYLTPPGAQGARPHYDTHDVFVLQVAGSKKWTIFGTPIESPLPAQDFDDRVHQLGPVAREFELQPGDMAYLPRGLAHEARSTDTVSLHITAGILRYTWADLLLEAVAAASLQHPALRKALPPGYARSGFDRTGALDTMQRLLQLAGTEPNANLALDSITGTFLSSCPPVLEGQRAQLAALDSLTIHSMAGARAGVIFRFQASDLGLIIDCYGRTITFPPQTHEAVLYALSTAKFVVSSLPGSLDNQGKMTVVRRLIREGLITAL